MKEILENWVKLQSLWIFLEAIFFSDDMKSQMKNEALLFEELDAIW